MEGSAQVWPRKYGHSRAADSGTLTSSQSTRSELLAFIKSRCPPQAVPIVIKREAMASMKGRPQASPRVGRTKAWAAANSFFIPEGVRGPGSSLSRGGRCGRTRRIIAVMAEWMSAESGPNGSTLRLSSGKVFPPVVRPWQVDHGETQARPADLFDPGFKAANWSGSNGHLQDAISRVPQYPDKAPALDCISGVPIKASPPLDAALIDLHSCSVPGQDGPSFLDEQSVQTRVLPRYARWCPSRRGPPVPIR